MIHMLDYKAVWRVNRRKVPYVGRIAPRETIRVTREATAAVCRRTTPLRVWMLAFFAAASLPAVALTLAMAGVRLIVPSYVLVAASVLLSGALAAGTMALRRDPRIVVWRDGTIRFQARRLPLRPELELWPTLISHYGIDRRCTEGGHPAVYYVLFLETIAHDYIQMCVSSERKPVDEFLRCLVAATGRRAFVEPLPDRARETG